MGTHPIFESDFDCLTDNEMGDTNLSLADILTELIESEEVIGCGFGDKNGLTLAVEGDISINDIAEGVAYASHCTPEESNVTIEEYLPNVSLISTYITVPTKTETSSYNIFKAISPDYFSGRGSFH